VTLLDERTGVVDGVPDSHVLFEEARHRRRRRRLVSGIVAILVGAGALAWWLATGAAPGQPPTTPTLSVGFPVAPSVPPGAIPIRTRSVSGWTIRIFASPSGLPLA
jgi:hypothetical protein